MSQVRVMTWNVENLFLPFEDGGPDTQEAFEGKLASLVGVIDQERPDVLGLQEIGSPEALTALQHALSHAMPHTALGDPDSRGIRVAILSVAPLSSTRKIRMLPNGVRPVQHRDLVFDDPATAADEAATGQMGRGALEATIEVDGVPVTVVTAHFKSKLISYPRQDGVVEGSRFAPNDEGERLRYAGYAVYLRTAEAMTIRARLDQLLANPDVPDDGLGRSTAVVFGGDLNDEPDAATTQIVQGPTGSESTRGPVRRSSDPTAATAIACGTSRRCCASTRMAHRRSPAGSRDAAS